MEHLRTLQRLLADGFISASEYEQRRQQLVDKLTDTTLSFGPEDDEVEPSSMRERVQKERATSSTRRDGRPSSSLGPRGRRNEARPPVTSTTSSTSTTASYDSSIARSTPRAQGLRYEPYGTSTSCAPAGVMDMAQKYTLSRKIGQLPEDALPSIIKIVERHSPSKLRQSGEDWTFDLETLEDHTLWKLNDFVNAQLKQHYGQTKDHTATDSHEAGMVEEEEEEVKTPIATTFSESDPENMEEDLDAGLLNDDDDGDSWYTSRQDRTMVDQDCWMAKHTTELKAAKRPRTLVLPFGAGEKRWKKDDTRKKGCERREFERAMTVAAKQLSHQQQRVTSKESDDEDGEDDDDENEDNHVLKKDATHLEHGRREAVAREQRRVVDEMSNDSESEYEREEYADPDTQPPLEKDVDDDGDQDYDDGDYDEDFDADDYYDDDVQNDHVDREEESDDEDWTPADAKPRTFTSSSSSSTVSVPRDHSSGSDPVPTQVKARNDEAERAPSAGKGSASTARERKVARTTTTTATASAAATAIVKREPYEKNVDRSTSVKQEPTGTSSSSDSAPVATGGKPFKIQVCIYSLAKKSNGPKPYACDACSKAFADRSNLIQHLRVHTKEKPYGCTYEGCDKRFAHSASLKEHLYTHTGDKPHVCHCGMSFAQASNLRRHQLVHTGEKPFVCTVPGCKKSFSQKINLAQHLKRVHKMRGEDIDEQAAGEDSVKPTIRPSRRGRSSSTSTTTSSSPSPRSTASSSSESGSR